MNHRLEAAVEAVGMTLDRGARGRLETLRAWLLEEAIPAGGLGPNEAEEIDERHLADSILFARGWRTAPSVCWDLGSGVGLPGLVLACLWKEAKLILIDASQRRCDLARRGGRLVGVDIEVRHARIEDLSGPCEAIVSRAAIPAKEFRPILARLLGPGGVAVISGSGAETIAGLERLPFPTDEFFDRDSRLLMMRAP